MTHVSTESDSTDTASADNEAEREDRHKVVLDVAAAKEVIDLIRDVPGEADEDLLEQALAAIEGAQPRLDTEDQKLAAKGQAVAIELSPTGAEAVETLIRNDRPQHPKLLSRIADRLNGKVKRARRKRRTRR